MHIANLKPGTRLMWDAAGNVYPALTGIKHHRNPWVKVLVGASAHWMGPDEESLRLPTDEELKQLTWPSKEHLTW